IDSGPIGNHGATLGLSDEDWRPGRLHNGLTFKPQQRSLVVVGAHASLNPSRAVSVALWVNARSWQGRPCLLEKGDDFQEYGLGIRQNQLQFFVRLNEGQTVRATAPLPRVNEWTHIAAIYDGQAAFLLVDGELLRSARAAGHPAAAHHDLTIGGRRSGNATAEDFFAGMIDEVLLYARALSLEEVRSLAAGKAP
ncbi:MAG TPA: LamG domain-containing protein, partial [Polyangia bacterium]